jgi:hypothetical protein
MLALIGVIVFVVNRESEFNGRLLRIFGVTNNLSQPMAESRRMDWRLVKCISVLNLVPCVQKLRAVLYGNQIVINDVDVTDLNVPCGPITTRSGARVNGKSNPLGNSLSRKASPEYRTMSLVGVLPEFSNSELMRYS